MGVRRLTRVLAFVALAIGILVGVGAASDRLAPADPVMKQRRALLRARGATIETVSLGNSHNRALDFDALGVRGLHLWGPGGDLQGALFMLEEARPRLPALRRIFIPASHLLLQADNSAPHLRARRMHLYVYTASLRHLPGDLQVLVQAKLLPVVRGDSWAGVARAIGGGAAPAGTLADGAAIEPPPPRRTAPELDAAVGPTARDYLASLAHGPGSRTANVQRGLATLERIAAVAAEMGAEVVLFAPPMWRGFARATAGESQDADVQLRQLDARLPNLRYVPVAGTVGWDRAEYFRDPDHLNAEGARAFSTMLRRALELPPGR